MTSYARTEVLSILLIGGAITAGVAWAFAWWALIPAVLSLALLSFYRDPPRTPPTGDRLLVAPADGKIMSVLRDVRETSDAAPELRINIFLSVLNVHINRSPCAGRVTAVDYRPGGFLNAMKPEATDENESNLVTLTPAEPIPGPVRIRQIAGLLARRIVCVAKPGDELALGERFGMIKLGSQTQLAVPEDDRWEVAVRPGQSVKGGLTVLARLK